MRSNPSFGPSRFLIAALVLTTAALSACGGGGGGGGTSTTPDSVTTAASSGPAVGTQLNASNCALQYTYQTPTPGTGPDPLLSSQWHLSNTGQSGGTAGEDIRATTAWSNFNDFGAGVRVAVIDDSTEMTHPDLAPNLVVAASHNYRPDAPFANYPMPCDASDTHGTEVAGVIAAAASNGVGGAGVAPQASLVSLNALATQLTADIGDALLRDNQNTAIYNNSWGSTDDGRLHPVDAIFRNSIQQGLQQGRGGKGSIYTFAAGNGGCYYGNRDATHPDECLGFSDNSNFDGYANQFGVITVCATNDQGKRPWYGEQGANILTCGVSSDLGHGTDTTAGFVTSTANDAGYTNAFSGTSASTPMVSGVIALMLAKRPDLTWRDVRLILAQSARENDPGDSGWTSNYGYHFNHKYGFGVVDANAAVALASTWTSVGGTDTLKKCPVAVSLPNLPIPDAVQPASGPVQTTPVRDTITIPSSCNITQIEYVQVYFGSDHTYGGDLQIQLISPHGLVSTLATSRLCYTSRNSPAANYVPCRADASNGDYLDSNGGWTFTSVRHMGESAAGNWQLEVTDNQPGDTGKITHWELAIWGR